MLPVSRPALALLLAALSLTALAQWTPRPAVEGVARTIADQYFDPARGAALAAQLREASARGDFDQFADVAALATALTTRLKPADGHLRVEPATHDGPAPRRPPMRVPAGRDGRAVPRAINGPDAGPGHHGIRKVEVLAGNIGYLALSEFADFDTNSDDPPARAAMTAALQQLAHTKAVIVDVRGNRGGSPAMVGYLASAFVAPGTEIYNVFHSRTIRISEAPKKPYATPRVDVPLYVLIDARTGSAAESFAYTLASARRATVIGEPSGGAANPGEFFDAGFGLRVFVPTGSPINPITHGNWEGRGVQPDVAVNPSTALDVALRMARLPPDRE